MLLRLTCGLLSRWRLRREFNRGIYADGIEMKLSRNKVGKKTFSGKLKAWDRNLYCCLAYGGRLKRNLEKLNYKVSLIFMQVEGFFHHLLLSELVFAFTS